MNIGNKTKPKVEILLDNDDDDDAVTHSYVQDEPADKTIMPEQDVIDNDWKPILGLDHIVNSYINMEVKLPSGDKELYGAVVGLCLDKTGSLFLSEFC